MKFRENVPEFSTSACRASITSVLEQVHVAHGLAGAQVVTGALSTFLVAKEHSGGLCSSLNSKKSSRDTM